VTSHPSAGGRIREEKGTLWEKEEEGEKRGARKEKNGHDRTHIRLVWKIRGKEAV